MIFCALWFVYATHRAFLLFGKQRHSQSASLVTFIKVTTAPQPPFQGGRLTRRVRTGGGIAAAQKRAWRRIVVLRHARKSTIFIILSIENLLVSDSSET